MEIKYIKRSFLQSRLINNINLIQRMEEVTNEK